MIKDTINSLRVTMAERIGNPFISAALIARGLVYWRLSLLLVADVSYDSKVAKIVDLYPTSQVQFESFLLYPLGFAVFWTFVWPAVSIFVNTYWYWMKSNISNFKLWAERKKKLSESEAAELYTTIDAQDGKYLELLKDRQNRIDSLANQIKNMVDERDRYLREMNSASERTTLELGEARRQLNEKNSEAEKLQFEVADQRRRLDDILSHSLTFAEHLPGLKEITHAISKATNHHANELWIREELGRQKISLAAEERQRALDFFTALGLLKKEPDGQICFGERYKYEKDKVLAGYKNPPDLNRSKSLPRGVSARSTQQDQ